MRKINYILTLLLLVIGANWAKADDQSLALGNYDTVEYTDNPQVYSSSWWMVAPVQFNVKYSGSQIIYTKEQLAAMKGKEIKSISFKYYNQSAFSAYPKTINVWMKEIDGAAFAYDDNKKAYSYFDYTDATKVATDFSFSDDFVNYYGLNGDIKIDFTTPFAYSGEKNLLVMITFDGDDVSDGASDIEMYYNTDEAAANKALATHSDKVTFSDFHESEDWPYAKGGGSSIAHADQLKQPLTKFTYQNATAPVVKDATMSGTVKCGETAVSGAKVTLTSGETKYEGTSGADGKYSIVIPAKDIAKEYTLTATAEGYEDYTAAAPVKFTSDEKKQLDITMVKKDVPSVLSGTVKSNDDKAPIKGATITLKNNANEYAATTDDNGAYTISVVKSEETYALTAKAEGYEDKTVSDVTFTPGSPKTLDITMIKIDNPSTMTGKVTCNGEPVEGAFMKLSAKDNKYVSYETTTAADGSYTIKVVKSEKTYSLSITHSDCNDYNEDNITFTPGETLKKDITMTKEPEPENSVTLGKYSKLLKDGDMDDVYEGHGFSWAAAPTNFTHAYTGCEIVYTKEQLAKMGGKAISKVNFIFHNESAYDNCPRTVKVWVKEIDNNGFEYDNKAASYKFYDYEDATVAIANYQYNGELYNYAGGNGELELTFDKPLNYSGNKNLLLVLTFEGSSTCNVLDFNFFYNPDMTKKAMSYFSDKFTFGDYSETEDWPYLSTDCVSSLEQPVTRFFYTEPTNGINDITTGNTAATKANAATYNLAGQRVGKDYKGIVICNGKKFKK